MLPHPTHDRLIALGLLGMAKAFEEQRQQPAVAALTFEERLGLLVDREAVERETKRLVTRLKFANLRQNATIEDLNTKAARGLDKALFAKLATGDWIGRRQDLLITGKTGKLPSICSPRSRNGSRASKPKLSNSTFKNFSNAKPLGCGSSFDKLIRSA